MNESQLAQYLITVFITLFFGSLFLWFVDNRSERFLVRVIDPWAVPLVNRIKKRRAYVVKRNLAKERMS